MDPLNNWHDPKVTVDRRGVVRVEDLSGDLSPGTPAGPIDPEVERRFPNKGDDWKVAFTRRLREMEPEKATANRFEAHLRAIFDQAYELLLKKHQDYGPLNIARAPGGPLNGLRVRMWDKLARINNLVDSGAEPENESLRDSFLDMLNYSAIAMMVLDGEWPGCD